RLTQREAGLTSQLADAAAMRGTLEQRLAQEVAHHEALDRKVAEMQSAAADAEQRFREEIAAVTARARHQVTQLESEFAKEREAHKERQARLLNDIQNLEAARGALDESLTSMREQRDGLERARLAAETEGQKLAAELTEARQNLDEARRNF